MSSFWNEFRDEDLSPLDLAEKKWALTNDDLNRQYKTFGQTILCDEKVRVQIQQLLEELKQTQERVHALWLEMIIVKVWVPAPMKHLLKTTPVTRDPEQVQKEKEFT